jgi:predicted permease
VTRWLAAVVVRLLPLADRESALGDLAENHARMLARDGPLRATASSARQLLALTAYALSERAAAAVTACAAAWRPAADVRDACRGLRRSPGFVAAATLSLAIGIGATSTMFGLLYDVLWRPLPVAHPEELVAFVRADPQGRDDSFTATEFAALQRALPTAQLTLTRDEDHMVVATDTMSTYLVGDLMDERFFPAFGLTPKMGRFFTREDITSAAHVAVISERLWERQLDRRPDIIGSTLRIRNVPFTVVGVVPAAFRGWAYPGWFAVGLPLTVSSDLGWRDLLRYDKPSLTVLARLPGNQPAARAAAMAAFANCCAAPDERLVFEEMRQGTGGSKNDFRNDVRPTLMALTGGVVLLLLLTCANVANLLGARVTIRRRETAVRLALGASRGRIVAAQLVECVVLAAAGGASGFAFNVALRRVLPALVPRSFGGLADVLRFDVDAVAVGIAIAVSGAVVLLAGLLPAIGAAGSDLTASIRAGVRITRGGTQRFERAGVAIQIAIALTLLGGGSLLVESLRRISNADTGLSAQTVYLAPIETRGTPLETAGIVGSHLRILDAVRALGGVRHAGMATLAPFIGGRHSRTPVVLAGPVTPPGATPLTAEFVGTTPEYFQSAGMRLVVGRDFLSQDAATTVVNEAAVEGLLGASPARDAVENVVGRQLMIGNPARLVTVVGVVANASQNSVRTPAFPTLYLPLTQSGSWPFVELAVATEHESSGFMRELRAAVAAAEPNVHLQFVTTMADEIRTSMVEERLAANLAVVFSVLAVGLAALGLYGVMAQHVGTRLPEFGIRAALGGRRADLMRDVGRRAYRVAWPGFVIGSGLAVGAGFALSSELYGVRRFEPALFGVALAILVAAAAAAVVIPARRAAHADVVSVLREP